jgi:hypothetical protein
MNLWAAIKREEREIEKQLHNLQEDLSAVRAAAKALGRSTGRDLKRIKKRVLSAAAREKMSEAARTRWAKVRAGAKKAVS